MLTLQVPLATAVANNGTLVVTYPANTPEPNAGGNIVVINDNDVLLEDEGHIELAIGPTSATITNKSGFTWPANQMIEVQFNNASVVTKFAALTQAGYDALTAPDPATLYLITDA